MKYVVVLVTTIFLASTLGLSAHAQSLSCIAEDAGGARGDCSGEATKMELVWVNGLAAGFKIEEFLQFDFNSRGRTSRVQRAILSVDGLNGIMSFTIQATSFEWDPAVVRLSLRRLLRDGNAKGTKLRRMKVRRGSGRYTSYTNDGRYHASYVGLINVGKWLLSIDGWFDTEADQMKADKVIRAFFENVRKATVAENVVLLRDARESPAREGGRRAAHTGQYCYRVGSNEMFELRREACARDAFQQSSDDYQEWRASKAAFKEEFEQRQNVQRQDGDVRSRLRALNKLLADGLVTEAEAAEKRRNILEDL